MKTQTATPASLPDEFLSDVLRGLRTAQKTLPCKYFYDDRGSQLFEQICDLDEYYLTRVETGILEDYCDQIVALCDRDLSLVEPGAGAGKKAVILLRAMSGNNRFIPLDISTEALDMTRQYFARICPQVPVRPIHGDFTDDGDVRRLAREIGHGARLVFFPGSTLGNFEPDQALSILRNLRELAGPEGHIVVGLDLIKDEARLLAAYNDASGVTASFNRNLLVRINRELGADFCVERFEHEAIFNRERKRVEMHLRSTCDQEVCIGGAVIRFRRDETIHTENSHKYALPMVEDLCRDARLQIDRCWMDDNQYFGVFRLKRVA